MRTYVLLFKPKIRYKPKCLQPYFEVGKKKLWSFFLFFLNRSLVEDDDAHMKVALGYGDMGISAHLQASKTGNTRFFTSNTHSSVVLQVRLHINGTVSFQHFNIFIVNTGLTVILPLICFFVLHVHV